MIFVLLPWRRRVGRGVGVGVVSYGLSFLS